MSASNGTTPPVARVLGQQLSAIPQDLYIPPDALEVFLEMFEGPLDLLLYLIRKQNLNILDIPVAEITRQYMDYLALMQQMRLELAAEYLVMAAVLAEIKSRLLLPRPEAPDDDEDDPRANLVRRLQEYERIKKAAEELDRLPRQERDSFVTTVEFTDDGTGHPPPQVDLKELLFAMKDVLARSELYEHHHVQRESLSVRERMSDVLELLNLEPKQFAGFVDLFRPEEGRLGVVVTFLAILELLRETLIEVVQAEAFAPVYVRLTTQ